MRFRIRGAHRDTGKESTFEVEATSREDAIGTANAAGYLVDSARPAEEAQINTGVAMNTFLSTSLAIAVSLISIGLASMMKFETYGGIMIAAGCVLALIAGTCWWVKWLSCNPVGGKFE